MTTSASAGQDQLGRLASVELRTIWPHEAHHFTPWLLANADVLSDVLGMDLDLTHAEHPVGGFSLDLIGVDLATNERVIIENQLETSDHGHLGQLLTYAGGTDPVNVVWVAKEFREEHRAALDWLNERTDEHTRFFGVEVAVVKIGNSDPAPLLTLVAQPNGWSKQVKSTSAATLLTERGRAYQEFWTRFIERVRVQRPGWTRAQQGAPQSWFELPSGTSTIALSCAFHKTTLSSEVYFGHPDAAVNQARYEAAHSHLAELEQSYGKALQFEPLDGKKACRIAEYRAGDITRVDEWDDYIAWFIQAQTDLRRAFETIGGFQALASV